MDSMLGTTRNVTGRCSCIQMMSGSVSIVTCENNVFYFITAEIMLKAMHLNKKMLCLWKITRKRRRLNFCMVTGELMRNFSQRHWVTEMLETQEKRLGLPSCTSQELTKRAISGHSRPEVKPVLVQKTNKQTKNREECCLNTPIF